MQFTLTLPYHSSVTVRSRVSQDAQLHLPSSVTLNNTLELFGIVMHGKVTLV